MGTSRPLKLPPWYQHYMEVRRYEIECFRAARTLRDRLIRDEQRYLDYASDRYMQRRMAGRSVVQPHMESVRTELKHLTLKGTDKSRTKRGRLVQSTIPKRLPSNNNGGLKYPSFLFEDIIMKNDRYKQEASVQLSSPRIQKCQPPEPTATCDDYSKRKYTQINDRVVVTKETMVGLAQK
ncbi:uncharacterized protein LOC117124767 [Anneissia japonica]|uniref:uncharacterized protein LOC117124767 n=1 Tax=Anneissia japonica TaxID=1529436 RepID=UPI0014255CEC|nr:uncharacterized protein LOC117124767 [Anneissia japonica]XP_033126980.1 uncharacterized protein LOC117124767 [Anneissia japonica]XP_033126981.1 uncharacterized protein LOC117124767 [Anneissia japonica]